ncbi:glycoside hydrolase/deacetylase [Neocallimastix lanati (nom. inval.)]|jgi:peptidoglycan/xylan/chitin deacetylase (PgdA/CDA1 family)|uniref:Glycoside hydrolase/deacetylase n=1 Tax=Neocallimastix californiae TaxID=1754190 RepID=A0A1Y2DGB6_9FUNG|nr:glycoside hydrolase/deacetylase [Neocallimastix sp. JGI-2020a]ORY58269.1 glycoside hydrolase/deacetylase [Neocallimastix californiae]|eukprot:ORY58269.1 glycoside hydrolase/deacetylase [Neocallimastix californiae]
MLSKINLKYITLSALLISSIVAKKAKIYNKCLKPGQFVLTFDDGPNPETTPIALEVLKKYNIKGTFFINAHNWSDLDNDPSAVEVIRKTFEAGHDIGSHTYNHKDLFSAIEEGTMKENVDDMTDKIESIIGLKPAYFRPPSGNGAYIESDPHKRDMSDKIQEYLGERGYSIIMWATDTRDWQYKEDVDKVIETMNEQLSDPNVSPKTHSFITLLHDVHATTVNLVLPAVIEYVQSLGYTFVSLSECIGISPYQGVSIGTNDQSNLNNGENENNSTNNNNNNNNNSTSNDSAIKTDIKPINNSNNTSDAITLNYSFFLSIIAAILSLIF